MDKFAGLTFDFSKLSFDGLFSLSSFVTSVFLVGGMLFVRSILVRYVRKGGDILDKDQRRWIIRIRNGSVAIIVLGLILIWAPQLHTFALSIAAFAAALVIATKEMILCLTGAVMRATSQPFRIGEWVTIDGITGEVIDLDGFAFHLQEVDMQGKTYRFTGRTVSVPNSRLFTSIIENANFFKNYIFEDVRVTVQFTDIDPARALNVLQGIAERHFAPHRDNAKEFNRKVRRRVGIDIETADPIYDLTTSDLGHYQFHARLFVPTALASNIGSDISKEFLSQIHAMRRQVQDKTDPAAEEEATALQSKSE